jgi:hypothetical protein
MRRLAFFMLLLALVALPALAQTPTGTLSGRVTDGTEALPGVAVTATSPSLQGERVATSSTNGDYIFTFLPPGEYKIRFELLGFQTLEAAVRVNVGTTARIDAVMPPSTVAEEITVIGSLERVSATSTAATTVSASLVEDLPIPRDLYNTVLFNPGVQASGPSNNIVISGAQSYENVFLINGVVVNDNIRGTPNTLFIEDAIEETTTSIAGISAEFGRFAGGIVNMITKSGGNDFSGSLRVNFDNDSWTAPTELTVSRADVTNETYEATFGGKILTDKLWFFLAGRDRVTTGSDQTRITAIPFGTGFDETRYEGKLTFALTNEHRLVGSYIERERLWDGYYFASLPIVDLASTYSRSIPEDLYSFNYTGVFSDKFFLEGQYSARHLTFVGSGGIYTDLTKGTVVYSNTQGYVGASPIFCGVCEEETRDNEDILLKASLFLTSPTLGAHDIVIGVDRFDDMHLSMNHQSGSDWFISATTFDFEGEDWYPVVYSGDESVDLDWYPILEQSQGSRFRTDSAFINDRWRLNDRLSFNIGFRYDKNDGVNSVGATVADDSKISPRLGLSWDIGGDGNWVANASYSQYVMSLANTGNVSDASPGGNPASFLWFYEGPEYNLPGMPRTNVYDVIDGMFNWFFNEYGGTENFDLLFGVDVPGVNRVIKDSLKSPYAEEISLGVTKRLGSRGIARLDYVNRNYKDGYETIVTTETGTVDLVALGINWGTVDLGYIQNSDYIKREYDGVSLSLDYRFTDSFRGGLFYTWSETYGNNNGETSGSGPVTNSNNPLYYPEYRDVAWSNPEGLLLTDQTHRGSLYLSWDVFNTKHHRLNVSGTFSYVTGQPYGAVGAVRSYRYVTNPGYLNRPSSVTYYFTPRDEYRWDDTTATGLALNYSFKFPIFGANAEIFLQPEVQNVFDEQAQISGDTTVYDNTNRSSTYAGFDPWTTDPVEGVNWVKGPNFGKATATTHYQTPRTFRFSVGFRF